MSKRITELAIAISAAENASRQILNFYGKSLKIQHKGNNPQDLLTQADLASDRAIAEKLSRHFPDYQIISEESQKLSGNPRFIWIVDPLDGTTNFTKEIPCFSISIGLVKDEKIVLGVVANPITNELLYAQKGMGAFLRPLFTSPNDRQFPKQRLHVSGTATLGKAFVSTGWWSRDLAHGRSGLRIFNRLAKSSAKIRYISGTVWNLTRVARGIFDVKTCDTAFLDIAAMILIIQEAGGVVTNDKGKAIKTFSTAIQHIVAANPKLNKQVVKLISKS